MHKYKTIDEFLGELADEKKAQVLQLREYIMTACPSLEEHIKWNAPSYVLNGEDRVTFNLTNKEQVIKLVFHMGATRKEDKKGTPILKDADLIEWVSDIRGYISFTDLEDVTKKEHVFKRVLKDWLALS